MEEKKRFYQKDWFMYIWLILFPPAGIVLLWAFHRTKEIEKKVIITAVFLVWFVVLLVSSGGFSNGVTDGIEKATSVTVQQQTTQPEPKTEEVQKVDIDPVDYVMCMGNMKLVVENVVGENFVHGAFDVKNSATVNGATTMEAQYMPDGAGKTATKVDITVVKQGNVYTTTEIMLAGNVAINVDNLSPDIVQNVDTGQGA